MQSKAIFKEPAKSILKKEPLARKKEIQWDEKAIEEYDLTRGQYQKIDEPKTPYEYANYGDEDEDEEKEIQNVKKIDIAQLNKKILEMQHKQEQGDESESDEETPEQKLKKKQFANKRKSHYNEIQVLKQTKLNPKDDQNEEDET